MAAGRARRGAETQGAGGPGGGIALAGAGAKRQQVHRNGILSKRLMDFPHSEIGLAKKLGLPRNHLREARENLKKGADWDTEGKEVVWTHAAAQAMALAIGATLDDPAGKNAGAEATVNEFTVAKKCVNTHALWATDKAGKEWLVRVTSNEHFRPGMVFRAEMMQDGWTLVGRCPRFPGRW